MVREIDLVGNRPSQVGETVVPRGGLGEHGQYLGEIRPGTDPCVVQPCLGRGTDPPQPPELGELCHPDLLLVVGSVVAGRAAQTGFSAWMIGPSEYPIRS